MKMTAEEIVSMYNQDKSRSNMRKIAELNGCTIHEVGEFLKNAASQPTKRKPGRPKSSSTRKTKKDTKSKTRNKVEPLPDELRPKTYIIPPLVESLTKSKIEELRRRSEYFENEAKRLGLEADELQDFLNGGFCDGKKDGI